MHPIESSLGKILPFLDKVFAALQKDSIDVSSYELDHICYRVTTTQRYEELKRLLAQHGHLLTEAMIAGRPIATYTLTTPLVYKKRIISCLELPSPKSGSPYPEGYEHVEFVIPHNFDDFIAQHPNLTWERSDKAINADISLRYQGFTVKFHHNTLEHVIKYLQ